MWKTLKISNSVNCRFIAVGVIFIWMFLQLHEQSDSATVFRMFAIEVNKNPYSHDILWKTSKVCLHIQKYLLTHSIYLEIYVTGNHILKPLASSNFVWGAHKIFKIYMGFSFCIPSCLKGVESGRMYKDHIETQF